MPKFYMINILKTTSNDPNNIIWAGDAWSHGRHIRLIELKEKVKNTKDNNLLCRAYMKES